MKEKILLMIGKVVSWFISINPKDNYHSEHPYYEDHEAFYHD